MTGPVAGNGLSALQDKLATAHAVVGDEITALSGVSRVLRDWLYGENVLEQYVALLRELEEIALDVAHGAWWLQPDWARP